MFLSGFASSQQGQGQQEFCWDAWGGGAQQAPAASQAPAAPQALAKPTGWAAAPPRQPLGQLPPLQQSRSGAAALSAQQAHQRSGWAPDPFEFAEAAQQADPAGGADGWCARSGAFLLGGQPPPAAASQHQQQQPQPRKTQPPAPQARLPTHQPPAPVNWAAPSAAAAATVTQPHASTAGGLASKPMPAAAAAKAPLLPVSCSLSLERYLEYWQLLTQDTGQVQQLSELQKSVLRAVDLKQIMLVSGLNSGSRSKRELLDKLGPLHLFSPFCQLPATSGVSTHHSGTTQWQAGVPAVSTAALVGGGPPLQVPLDAEAMLSLGWLQAEQAGAADAVLQPGHGAAGCASCCPLPAARICLPACEQATTAPDASAGGWQQLPQAVPAAPAQPSSGVAAQSGAIVLAQPADSDVTMASLGAAAHARGAVQCSPGIIQQHQRQANSVLQAGSGRVLPGPGGVLAGQVQAGHVQAGYVQAGQQQLEEEEGQEGEEGEEEELEHPEWLVQGIARVAEGSQASQDPVAVPQLLGRRVCFVLLEDFEQDDPQGVTDTLDAGVLQGQVVERVSVDHDEGCPDGCTQCHAFFYVRLAASRSTAPPARQAGRRLEIVLDLQPRYRVWELDGLLGMDDDALQDAWVLLEPRQEPEAELAAQSQQAADMAGPGTTAAAAASIAHPAKASGSRKAGSGGAGQQVGAMKALDTDLGGWRTKRTAQPAQTQAGAWGAKRQR